MTSSPSTCRQEFVRVPVRGHIGFKDAAGVTPADVLGNLNSFLDDEDSADADILTKMIVDACVNVGVPETLDKSLVEIRDLLSRFIVYREHDPSSISIRVCSACAIIVPRGFCYCTACKCEFVSTGKFVIHVDSDEPKPSDTTNVTEEVKQAQREAKEDAERFVSEEERPDTQEMSEERSAGRSYTPSDIGTDIDDEDAGVCPDNAEEDADAIQLLQVKAICVDEAGEASYLSGFIGVVLFKVWKVFANNEADVVKEPGKEGGLYCPYMLINGRDDWDVDETNIPIPPTYEEVTAAPTFKNVRFKSANHRDEEMFLWFLKLRGLYITYRIWTACNILGIKAEQFRGVSHQKDIAFISDTIFRCIALGLNCDYMTLYRTDVNIGRKFLKLELAAIICIQSVKEVDAPLIQWCYSRNTHLPSRFIEKINRTEETPQISVRKVPVEGE